MLRRIRIKLLNWEYWPIWLVYAPVSFYYIYLSLKARSLYFFSASNPTIKNGGMFFESKWRIFELIPKHVYPKTLFVNGPESYTEALNKLKGGEIHYPFIAKPDVGGRGNAVQLIYSENELHHYNNQVQTDYIIQAYSPYKEEVSVFYERLPDSPQGQITSFTYKELLSVVGDGVSTIEQLMNANDRAFLQLKRLKNNPKVNLNQVLKKSQKHIIVPYGNHCLGAKFVNYNHLINNQLTQIFDELSKQINGFYFGRYDIKCQSINDLLEGKHFHIVELNGAGAEPAHIYHPGYSFFKAQKDLARYYKSMYLIATQNHLNGLNYLSHKEFIKQRKLEKQYKRKISIAC